jgi:hypothetical protein
MRKSAMLLIKVRETDLHVNGSKCNLLLVCAENADEHLNPTSLFQRILGFRNCKCKVICILKVSHHISYR